MPARLISAPLLILLGSLALGCSESLIGPADLTEPGERAFLILKGAPVLAGASVGFAGTTPVTVEAFRVLLKEPEASSAFKSLLDRSSKAGQLYALAGLYYIDRGYMERVAGKYLRDESRVETAFGCIVDRQRVSEMAARIVSGSLAQEFRGVHQ